MYKTIILSLSLCLSVSLSACLYIQGLGCIHTQMHNTCIYIPMIYIQVRVSGENHENVAHALNNMGSVSLQKGNFPEAMKYYQRSQDIFTRHKSPKVFSIVT